MTRNYCPTHSIYDIQIFFLSWYPTTELHFSSPYIAHIVLYLLQIRIINKNKFELHKSILPKMSNVYLIMIGYAYSLGTSFQDMAVKMYKKHQNNYQHILFEDITIIYNYILMIAIEYVVSICCCFTYLQFCVS